MVKTKSNKAYCQCGFDSPPVARSLVPVCFITHIVEPPGSEMSVAQCVQVSNTMSRWCNGSIRVSITLGGNSSLSRDARLIPSSPSW